MDAAVGSLLEIIRYRQDNGHDIVDRLSYEYTPLMLLVSAASLMGNLFFGSPIQCWFPPQFTGDWEAYAHSYCYIKNTYYLPLREQISQNFADRDKLELSYYQWVPFVLVVQAILFIVPCVLWRFFSWQSGISVKGVLTAASKVRKNFDQKCREDQCDTAAVHIQEALDMQYELTPKGRFCGWLFYGSHYGNYVTGVYLIVKILYIVNVVGQFLILNAFLGPKYTMWGYEILRDLAHGREWEESSHFPRVTMCDFQVRVLGNLHRWTVQCVLMINMFNEKIYIFFWWWFLLLGVLSTLSLIYWALTSVFHSQRRAFVAKYLRVYRLIQEYPGPKEERLLNRFLTNNLRSDGVLLIRMIQGNGGELLTGDLIKSLWLKFKQRVEGNNADPGFIETPAS